MALEDERNMDLAYSRYDETIRRLDAAGVGDRVLYLFYEDMTSDAGLDRINRFLGVSTMPVDKDARVLETAKWSVAPTPAVFERAETVLRPTYDFIRARFGSEVPARWRKPAEVAPRQMAEVQDG
jgi:hypothetical protein